MMCQLRQHLYQPLQQLYAKEKTQHYLILEVLEQLLAGILLPVVALPWEQGKICLYLQQLQQHIMVVGKIPVVNQAAKPLLLLLIHYQKHQHLSVLHRIQLIQEIAPRFHTLVVQAIPLLGTQARAEVLLLEQEII